jgi:hypothetical protein
MRQKIVDQRHLYFSTRYALKFNPRRKLFAIHTSIVSDPSVRVDRPFMADSACSTNARENFFTG